MSCGNCSKGTSLCPLSFGLAWGLTFALMMLAIAWVGWWWGYGSAIIAEISNIYSGYEASLIGGLWGALWGFIEGFIMGFLVAFFYDLITKCCRCCKKSRCACMKTGGSCQCGPECKCNCCSKTAM
jgi:hypothetical protein